MNMKFANSISKIQAKCHVHKKTMNTITLYPIIRGYLSKVTIINRTKIQIRINTGYLNTMWVLFKAPNADKSMCHNPTRIGRYSN